MYRHSGAGNQLAVAIRNAQLLEEQERSLEENLRLYSDAHDSLEEIQRLNRQLTRQAWDGFTQSHIDMTSISTNGQTVTFNAGWTPLMVDAYHARDTVMQMDEDVRSVATPIMLRDEVLGAVEVIGANEEEINLIDAIVAFTQRFAVALENIRLIEESACCVRTGTAYQRGCIAVPDRGNRGRTTSNHPY